MRSAFHFVKLFRLTRGFEETAAKPVRHNLVGGAVNEKLRTMDSSDLIHRLHFRVQECVRKERQNRRGHVCRRRETRLNDQACRLDLAREVNSGRASQRFAEDDYVCGGYAAVAYQIIPRRSSVQI